MLPDANFLCEIGTEEIPAGYLPPAIENTKKILKEELESNRLDYSEIEVLATPRRISCLVSGLSASQRQETEELKGPSVKAAYDEKGNPTRALEGFLKGNGLEEKDIERRDTGKGEYIFGKKELEARASDEIIPGITSAIIERLGFPKQMKWGARHQVFARPVRYFTILHNDSPLEFDIQGITASSKTRGHYIQNNHYIPVSKVKEYENLLEKEGVILDHNRRREMIREQLHEAAKKAGGKELEDEDLLETVTFLVEQPHVVVCTFQEEFLRIPGIVLIAEMKEHQKYFAVVNEKGELTNRFLVVSNNPKTEHVVSGNERVIAARFADADFFYTEDRKVRLEERVEGLKNVLFHKKLGSVYDKVERMRSLAGKVREVLSLDDILSEKIDRAILLSKTDLETFLVNEFSSLQGKIGHIYALEDGEDPEVARAIEDQYRPRGSEDSVPTGMVSVVVSMVEKLDNIFGSWSVGNIPRGSQDPYALRRQAGAVIDMIIENELVISLRELLEKCAGFYQGGESLVPELVEFFEARAKTIFSTSGFNHDEIDAVLATGATDYLELFRRARSLNEYRKGEHFSELLLGFKRMKNILSAFRKENPDYTLSFSEDLLEMDEEKELYRFFRERQEEIKGHIESSRYQGLFDLLIEARGLIDRFFDEVMVMDKRTEYRDNRLALLEMITRPFDQLLDFSRISDR
jgi:glycyl-tRNA synthetase beta chain